MFEFYKNSNHHVLKTNIANRIKSLYSNSSVKETPVLFTGMKVKH